MMWERAMVRTRIQLTEEQAQALREMAVREHVSVAELIRRAVDGLIQAGPVSVAERRQRAMAAVSHFRSGLSDLAERHDDYLDEAYGDFLK